MRSRLQGDLVKIQLACVKLVKIHVIMYPTSLSGYLKEKQPHILKDSPPYTLLALNYFLNNQLSFYFKSTSSVLTKCGGSDLSEHRTQSRQCLVNPEHQQFVGIEVAFVQYQCSE